MKYYKVLKKSGICIDGRGYKWDLPIKNSISNWTAGKWMPKIQKNLWPYGYMVFRRQELINWLEEAIFEVEIKGEIEESTGYLIVQQARLLRNIETWNQKSARLFAASCAEHVLPIFENKYPNEDRPRKAVNSAIDYALGKINKENLDFAGVAAQRIGDECADASAESAAKAAWIAASSLSDRSDIWIKKKYHKKAMEMIRSGKEIWLGGRDVWCQAYANDSLFGVLISNFKSSLKAEEISWDEITWHCAYHTAQAARFAVEDAARKVADRMSDSYEKLTNKLKDGDIKGVELIKDTIKKIPDTFPINYEQNDFLTNLSTFDAGGTAYKLEENWQTEKLFELLNDTSK